MADAVPDFAPPEIGCPACHAHGPNQILVHPGEALTLAPLVGGVMGWLTERYGPARLRTTGGAFRRAWLDGLAEAEPTAAPHYVCLACRHTWPVQPPPPPPPKVPPAPVKPASKPASKPAWTPPTIQLDPSKPIPPKPVPAETAPPLPPRPKPSSSPSKPPSRRIPPPPRRPLPLPPPPSRSLPVRPPRSTPAVPAAPLDRHVLHTRHRFSTLRWHRARGSDALEALSRACPVCHVQPNLWCDVE